MRVSCIDQHKNSSIDYLYASHHTATSNAFLRNHFDLCWLHFTFAKYAEKKRVIRPCYFNKYRNLFS